MARSPFAHWGQALVSSAALWILFSMNATPEYVASMALGFVGMQAAGLVWFVVAKAEGTSLVYLLFAMLGQLAGSALSIVVAFIFFPSSCEVEPCGSQSIPRLNPLPWTRANPLANNT